MSRLTLTLALALLAVEATVAAWIIATGPEDDWSWVGIALAVTVGVAFVASGLIAQARRPENRTGIYLLAVGYFWFLGGLTSASSSLVFSAGWVLSDLMFIPFTALVLGYPTGRLETRLERAIPLATALVLVPASLLALLFDPTPAPDRCPDCAGSAIVIADVPEIARIADLVSSLGGLALIATIVWILVGRWRRASPALRRLLWPVLGTGAATLLSVAALVIGDLLSTTVANAIELVFLLSFAAVPIAFLFGVLRTRLARTSVTDVVLALESGISIRDALASALDDPSLAVVYRVAATGQWVDPAGRRVPEPVAAEGRAVTTVDRLGLPVAALIHDASLTQEPELVGAVAAAAGLSLHNERLQAELRAQYSFLETVADTAPSLLVVIDTEGRILNQNAATVIASGHEDEEQLRGQFFWDVFISPDEREAVIERFRDSAPDFPAADYENTFVNVRGERRVIAWRSAPVPGADGRVESIVAGGIDITERHQREQELQRERDATTTVLQAIPSLIVVLNVDGAIVDRDTDNPGAAVNRAFREAFGWSDLELVGRRLVDLLAPADRELAESALRVAAAGGVSGELESSWLRADGADIAIAWRASAVTDVTGRTDQLVLVTGTDVTERLRHEEEVRASRARLVAAGDDARRVLERNLHDGAQQRLVALSLSLRLAESRLGDDPAQAAAILAAAREELAQALEELRELARGIHPAILTDRGLAAAVDALVNRSPIAITASVDVGALEPAVEAAAYYVIAEALTNVTKYAQADTARVTVAVEGQALVVEVSDDGVGGAAPDTGSGLRGLTDRVGALDGALSVESPRGGGTRVVARIPIRPAVIHSEP